MGDACREAFDAWCREFNICASAPEFEIWQAAWNSRAPSKAERDGVLEEAAKVCDALNEEDDRDYGKPWPSACAEAIRAMKGRP